MKAQSNTTVQHMDHLNSSALTGYYTSECDASYDI